jgi:hypothetical protein
MADAQRWIDRLNLRNEDITRAPVDLAALFEGHSSEGRYRLMIYQAADRILRKRGATTNLGDFDMSHHRQGG